LVRQVRVQRLPAKLRKKLEPAAEQSVAVVRREPSPAIKCWKCKRPGQWAGTLWWDLELGMYFCTPCHDRRLGGCEVLILGVNLKTISTDKPAMLTLEIAGGCVELAKLAQRIVAFGATAVVLTVVPEDQSAYNRTINPPGATTTGPPAGPASAEKRLGPGRKPRDDVDRGPCEGDA